MHLYFIVLSLVKLYGKNNFKFASETNLKRVKR
jgi:hypothetical protein